MMTEVIKKLTTSKKTNEMTSDDVLSWTKKVKARVQKAMLDIPKKHGV